MKKIIILLVLLLLPLNAYSFYTTTGKAYIIDGDTIIIDKIKFRLIGVDAPEISQLCYTEKTFVECGVYVKDRLINLVKDKDVTCYYLEKDFYGRYLAECVVDGAEKSINEWLLYNGLAYYYYNKGYTHYKQINKKAIENKTGLYQYNFENPKDHRKQRKMKN